MRVKMSRWRGSPALAWVGLIAALTGAGVLIEGLSPRAASAQVEVFVTNYLGDSITSYSRTARGFLTPLRNISGPATGLEAPAGLVVDTVNNEILVANVRSITVYSLMANGNAAPLRTITGAALQEPIGLAVDTVHGELFVANASSITVYSRMANGNVPPLRTISGAATGLTDPFGLAVDVAHGEPGEVLVANFGGVAGPDDEGPKPGSITVYSRTANGNVAPLRTISGGLQNPRGLALDTVNNQVLAVNVDGNGTDGPPQLPSITVHSRTANGNVAPVRTIRGTATRLLNPIGLAVDTTNNEVLVANFGGNDAEGQPQPPAVTVYSRTANGSNVAPLRDITGPATALNGPAFPVVAATCPPVFDFDFSDFRFSVNAYARCFRDLLRGGEITAGEDLGGTRHTSLNVRGTSGSTPTTWLTVYGATPASPAGPIFGAQTLCADILTVPFNNIKGAGLVALLNEGAGKKGLALVIHEAGNTDALFLATVDGDPAQKGKLTTLASVPLSTPPEEGIGGKTWYRLIMTVEPASSTVTGKVFRHLTPADPNSALTTQVGTTLVYSPGALPSGVQSPGEDGILGSSINAVLNVSVTNFSNNAAQCGP